MTDLVLARSMQTVAGGLVVNLPGVLDTPCAACKARHHGIKAFSLMILEDLADGLWVAHITKHNLCTLEVRLHISLRLVAADTALRAGHGDDIIAFLDQLHGDIFANVPRGTHYQHPLPFLNGRGCGRRLLCCGTGHGNWALDLNCGQGDGLWTEWTGLDKVCGQSGHKCKQGRHPQAHLWSCLHSCVGGGSCHRGVLGLMGFRIWEWGAWGLCADGPLWGHLCVACKAGGD
mmetsp:Transcript_13124/g.24084  ORF Transcript_13124/g.24084 Transcript_13124/m.24084 type:complete len:232 (-) Transcript_13124:231-926(-)